MILHPNVAAMATLLCRSGGYAFLSLQPYVAAPYIADYQ